MEVGVGLREVLPPEEGAAALAHFNGIELAVETASTFKWIPMIITSTLPNRSLAQYSKPTERLDFGSQFGLDRPQLANVIASTGILQF